MKGAGCAVVARGLYIVLAPSVGNVWASPCERRCAVVARGL